nr:ATP synthase F0 subunit 8 [Linognathus vituli]
MPQMSPWWWLPSFFLVILVFMIFMSWVYWDFQLFSVYFIKATDSTVLVGRSKPNSTPNLLS